MDERETTKLRKALGTRCRALRAASDLSQLDIVRYFDFSLSHYQKIERGDLDPKLSTLARLAQVFDVSLGELLEGVGLARVSRPKKTRRMTK